MGENKKNAIIWGAGGIADDFLNQKVLYADYNIACIVDNDPDKWGSFFKSYPVASPTDSDGKNVDTIIICSNYVDEIREQIFTNKYIDIDPDGILSYKQVANFLAVKLCLLNKNNNDPEIRKVIDEYKLHGLNIYGYYKPQLGIRYDVYRDANNWPYVNFEDKRMYYPYDWNFKKDFAGEYVEDILKEQQPGSPHLYIRSENDIPYDSVIVDAGVCEGNFALRYVDRARKMYLIESDRAWCGALEKTFEPYKDKVAICNRFLSGNVSDESITLDSLVSEKIDFLKMDIEGAEVEALKGAAGVLKRSDAKCAICSYHRYKDEYKIKEILNDYGYSTSISKGYMFFTYDDNMPETMDFRRGIVYGEKN